MERTTSEIAGDFADGRLRIRPTPPTVEPALAIGLRSLKFPDGREAEVHVPTGYNKRTPAPLLVLFHGAYGRDGGATALATAWAERHGTVLIAQKSIGPTWDLVRGGCGPDVAFLDFLLEWTMQRYAIDAARISIAGFSDGASFALSLGLMNGDLFHDILAFSPGFARTRCRNGRPRIFVAHGTEDAVLPVDFGRRIAQRLANEGYDLQYHEFDGGHVVLPPIAEAAMDRFLG